jgi:hypothetical protein
VNKGTLGGSCYSAFFYEQRVLKSHHFIENPAERQLPPPLFAVLRNKILIDVKKHTPPLGHKGHLNPFHF